MPARAKSKANSSVKSEATIVRPPTRPQKTYPVLEGTDALRAFQDSGCLFYVNWMRLHTTGHVLRFDRSTGEIVPLWIDMTEQPEQCVFTDEELEIGLAKMKEFAAKMESVIRLRKRRLGYVRQSESGGGVVSSNRVG